ncbi:MAG: hypothetical protein P8L91_06275, partial [Candidatus Marinimicrobia bacterium]|nr:hypothetical protein [Candidatus Neomarinimicrobiota bacterium]
MYIFISSTIFSQESNSINSISHISGRISTTNNGISRIPTFSLGKPAVLFNLSLGKKKFSFEPGFNFSLEGKPWSMLFWFRYKMVQRDNFSMRIGINPNFSYRTITTYNNGISKNLIETRRFLAGEVMPIYSLSKNFKVGIYYIYAFGFDDSSKHTNFLVFNTFFPSISISNKIDLVILPNIYYLKMDELEGFYFSSTFRLTIKNSPFSFESIINKKIDSEILPETNFDWNVSLNPK